MKDLSLSFGHLPIVSKKESPKIDHEFQELGVEMMDFFKKEEHKRMWTLFYKKDYTIQKIRYAFKECKTRNKCSVGYMEAIIKNCK